MKKAVKIALIILFGAFIFTGCSTADKEQGDSQQQGNEKDESNQEKEADKQDQGNEDNKENQDGESENQWKNDLLTEFYSIIDESDTTVLLDSIQLTDGKWRMIFLDTYNNHAYKEWQFKDRISGNCWDFTLKDGEPTFIEGWDYDKYTIEGDIEKLLAEESWRKWALDGNNYFSLNQNAYKESDDIESCTELLKNKVVPFHSKKLAEDSPITIKANEAGTKFIYSYGTNWRPYFHDIPEDSPVNTVTTYFIKTE